LNLNWGQGLPFHPDENNIAISLQQLNCHLNNIRECFNPHFFAYGQFLTYVGFIFLSISKFFLNLLYSQTTNLNPIMILRILSAISSLITVVVCFFSVKEIIFKRKKIIGNTYLFGLLLLLILSPGLIQQAHFGTTESFIMMFYSFAVYFSILFIKKKIDLRKFINCSILTIGLAVATKASSLIIIGIPFLILIVESKNKLRSIVYYSLKLLVGVLIISIIFSPYNLISFKDFFGTLNYESSVALGNAKVFYTRQYEYTIPILFQFIKIFPYTLGLPLTSLFLAGLFLLPFNKINNFLRIFFLLYFIPSAFLYAKWTRFAAPVFPLMIIISFLFIYYLNEKLIKITKNNIFFWILILICILPGIAFLSIYLNVDSRIKASEWMLKNIPNNSYILSETANVVDLPASNKKEKTFRYVSFNFYELDNEKNLNNLLQEHLKNADYIFVLSRRLYANHTCYSDSQSNVRMVISLFSKRCEELKKKYPLLNDYYKTLFEQKKFKKVAEFSSYPTIKLFDKKIIEIKDEWAEETFSVFDHPVIRVYKKI